MTENIFGQQQFYEKYLSFNEALLKAQVKNMKRLMASVSFEKLSKIDVQARIKSGRHIIDPRDIVIEENDLEELYDRILPIVKKYYGENEELKRFDDLNDKRKFSLKVLVENLLLRNEDNWQSLSEKLNLSKNTLLKMAEYISAPYFEMCAEYFNQKFRLENWKQSFCPICGNEPSMAMVNEKKGYRVLWCCLCETEWRFKENVCPFCWCNDLKKIKHIFPQNSSSHRIDACDNCKKYLKTIDGQMITKVPNFVVEHFATYRLDILAHEKGYKMHITPYLI